MQKTISLVTIIGLLVMGNYVLFEPTLIKAAAVDDPITVTQGVTQEITITHPDNVTMSAAITGITGNPGSPRTGSAEWTVRAANATGFTLTLAATTTPAMQLDGTYNFSDYTSPTSTQPEYTWASPASAQAEFGYTVEPETAADTATLFKDDGVAACNTGTQNGTNTCWDAASTTAVTIVYRTTNTDSTGEAEVVKFQTESNAKFLKEGNYTAEIWVTATEN